MSQDKIVTCFHEYVMKKYKYYESILCHSNSKSSNKVLHHSYKPKLWQTCQISAIGNIKYTRWGNMKTKKKGGRRGTTSSSTKSGNKGLISKTAGSTNAGKKALATNL